MNHVDMEGVGCQNQYIFYNKMVRITTWTEYRIVDTYVDPLLRIVPSHIICLRGLYTVHMEEGSGKNVKNQNASTHIIYDSLPYTIFYPGEGRVVMGSNID